MKINQIIQEMTAGSVATVAMPLGGTRKRAEEAVDVPGLKPVDKIAKAKKKGPYQNSIVEGKKKDFLGKLQKSIEQSNKAKKDTEEKVKQHQDDQDKKKVDEAKLDEDDIIVVPGQKVKRKTGFVPHGQSRVDHEVEMARSDVLATMKNAKAIYNLLKDKTEEEGIEGWVQEKLIKANDYLNAVKEYYDEKMMQEAGVIAAGGVGENVGEEKQGLWANIHAKRERIKHGSGEKMRKPGSKGSPSAQDFKDAAKTSKSESIEEVKQRLDPKCWKGKHKEGTKIKGGVRVNNCVPNESVELDEKAKSKAQQRFMGMAHAIQKGKKIPGASKELKDVAKSMSKKDAHDFAATKHKGLPEKVKKDK